MKKARPPKQAIGKQAYVIAKSLGTQEAGKTKTVTIDPKVVQSADNVGIQEQLKKFEAEVMGEQSRTQGSKSDIKARNLEQMINVLHHKLESLESIAKIRLHLCEEDLNYASTECSKQAPRLTDEFEDISITKAQKEALKFTTTHRDNLVSSDNVFIDATHLVLRTKPATETGKKLELQLEESFGAANLRELKGKKTKSLHRMDKTKKSVRQKFEAKKQIRIKLEKDLHANMDNYVTRSVNDPELKFKAPLFAHEEPKWPITIKWPTHNKRSQSAENADGEMDPELLLWYSLERINLPSGETMFRWLIRQDMFQHYFVYLFWLIKVKFFQPDSTDEDEGSLLKILSVEYVRIVELLAERTHAEHEKDFVFRYLPYIFANAIYYAFYFLCPGSRHIYTRAFRKTILMQVVQVMHGVQLSQLSVKVSWAKLFPDEAQEAGDEADGEETGEIFPVQLAFSKKPKEDSHKMHHHSQHLGIAGLDEVDSSRELPVKELKIIKEEPAASKPVTPFHYQPTPAGPLPPVRKPHGSLLSDMHHLHNSIDRELAEEESAVAAPSSSIVYSKPHSRSAYFNSVFDKPQSRGGSPGDLRPGSSTESSPEKDVKVDVVPASREKKLKKTQSTSNLSTGGSDTLSRERVKPDILGRLPTVIPTARTMLKPPKLKPPQMHQLPTRQNKELIDAKEISPVMQQYLWQGTDRGPRGTQYMARTAPISWCVCGGSDTHRRRPIQKELYDEISLRASRAHSEYYDEVPKWRRRRIAAVRQVERACAAVLSSGHQSISRFSLDLIKQKKLHLKGGHDVTSLEEAVLDPNAGLAQYYNYEDEDIEAFLENI